jgi:hypothetical protein
MVGGLPELKGATLASRLQPQKPPQLQNKIKTQPQEIIESKKVLSDPDGTRTRNLCQFPNPETYKVIS